MSRGSMSEQLELAGDEDKADCFRLELHALTTRLRLRSTFKGARLVTVAANASLLRLVPTLCFLNLIECGERAKTGFNEIPLGEVFE